MNWHWLIHGLGIDTQQSWWYDSWSGFIPAVIGAISASAIVFTVTRMLNCHVKGCWRWPARFHVADNKRVCGKHHHEVTGIHPRHLTVEKLRELHLKHLERQ